MAGLFSLRASLAAGLLIRLACMFYGVCQDSLMSVKYTDIDYYVFTDAARFVILGESPYNRATYRYTPILSWMLIPNITLTMLWGKLVFITFDILAGYLIYRIVTVRGCSRAMGIIASWVWLLNPLPVTVSSRGNAESIMAALVLATFYFLCVRRTNIAAVMFGISVHFKIYPLIYSLPLYLVLSKDSEMCVQSTEGTLEKIEQFQKTENSDKRRASSAEQKKSKKYIKESNLKLITDMLWPTKARLSFVILSVSTLGLLTLGCYVIYGWEFLEETYLYHITRKDTRHNFSVYFYLLYLTESSPHAALPGVLAFLPQILLLLVMSLKFHQDPIFASLLNTLVFVAFNKVCTSQYFLWYLTLLPVVIPYLQMRRSQALGLVLSWFLGQAVWLYPAYLLEFEGHSTFIWIWLAGIIFFIINTYIITKIISSYCHTPLYANGQLHKQVEVYTLPAWVQFYVGKTRSQ